MTPAERALLWEVMVWLMRSAKFGGFNFHEASALLDRCVQARADAEREIGEVEP